MPVVEGEWQMNTVMIDEFFGACFEARRIVELMPKLPNGMKPSHIHVIDILHQMQEDGEPVRISDVGKSLHVTNPGITRILNELEEMKAIKKVQSKKDKRVFTVSLTALGCRYYSKYIEEYHSAVAKKLAGIPERDMKKAAGVIHEAYCIMSAGNMKIG